MIKHQKNVFQTIPQYKVYKELHLITMSYGGPNDARDDTTTSVASNQGPTETKPVCFQCLRGQNPSATVTLQDQG